MADGAQQIIVSGNTLTFAGCSYRCAIGRDGITEDKREGDHKTPVGSFPLRQCFYRPDRLDTPETPLACIPLTPDDGWCDDPMHGEYNRYIKLTRHSPLRGGAESAHPARIQRDPVEVTSNDGTLTHRSAPKDKALTPALSQRERGRSFSFEHLWREDERYDILVPLGYNDAPVVAGKGSAIFLHVAAPDYTPTEGCVALARNDLLAVLKGVSTETTLAVLNGEQ